MLETLTCTSAANTSYSVTIRRAAFVWPDREHAELVLEQLTKYRNRYVHAGSESDEINALPFLLKRHVERLLEVSYRQSVCMQNYA